MEKQTLIFTALPNGRTADGSLKLSVFISPRLWNADTSVKKMKLSQFPDFLPWTDLVGAATWEVEFQGGPTLNATSDDTVLREDLWSALFKPDTDVLPFQFDDYRGSEITTSPTALINDYLTGIYVKAATEPSWGAGKDLPKFDVVAADPDIRDIALPSHPHRPVDPGDRPPPKDLGGRGPRPNPEPKPDPDAEPEPRPDRGCCLCGCLAIPFAILAQIIPPLKPILDRICLGKSPDPDVEPEPEEKPNLPVAPFPELPPAAPPKATPPPKTFGPSFTPAPGPPSATRIGFAKLRKFLEPFSTDMHELPTIEQLEEIYDFHQMISSLGDYPDLLRMFGLVIDLVVPLNGAVPPAAATVKVKPAGFQPEISTPRTHYTLTATGFAARQRPVDPEISNGFLRFNDTNQFRVIQVDTVGGGKKVEAMATNCVGFEDPENRPPNMPDTTGLPALRSAGISVVRVDVEAELNERFTRSFALQQAVFAIDNAPQLAPPADAGPPPAPTDELFAEDVVRGYRIDVFDSKSKLWHSLCQRDGTYTFLEPPNPPGGQIVETFSDEGFVQLGVTEPFDEGEKKTLHATDSLFVWDGWSLCAPRPGMSISKPNPDDPDDVDFERPKNEAKTKFKLETEFTATLGTLPRLRYDYEYRLRARVCDLAGNSIVRPNDPIEFAKDVPEQTPDFPCARFEPVSPPSLLLRARPVEGESLERLVVRTGDAIAPSEGITERHVVPPKISQLMAEQHGKFDLVPKMDDSGPTYDFITEREGGALTDIAVQIPQQEGNPLAESDPWVQEDPQVAVPYLPDPSSKGVLFLGLPGLNPEEIIEPTALKRVNKIPFDDPWPDPLPFRIRLVAIGPGDVPDEPKWEDGAGEAQRVLTIQLAAAEQKVVSMSSYLEADDLKRQGVNQWVKQEAPAAAPSVELDTVSGRSWLQLPWRDITLVHAVPKPLGPPTADVKSPPTDRKLGETFATLSGTVTSDSLSTGKIDLRAKWIDDIDELPAGPSLTPQQETYICELQVELNKDETKILDSATKGKIKHQFGDTKYHKVTYMPTATTRFREYFPEIVTNNPANISVQGPDSAEVDIFSSKRPDAPRVLYVVPTFQWVDDAAPPPDTVSRTRRGGGLRVYLDRPWYSSGSGELLGVVFAEGKKFLSLEEHHKPYLTQWGVDPIWLSPATDESASMGNFKGTDADNPSVTLEERDDLTVSVVGYAPEFDSERKLWFADIQLKGAASYTPFVRLALVRFQPTSIENAHISRVVRAEFAQYAPDRVASVTTTPTGPDTKIHVVVKGLTYEESSVTITKRDFWGTKESGRTGSAEIEVSLQRRNPNLGNDPHLGWETIGKPTLLSDDKKNPRKWEGDVILEASLGPGTYRVLLQEYEWYRSDFEPEENIQKATVARRVVYADAFLIS